ncbi:DUF2934 domain-containing protein [Melittangium boletus]|uniref:DUF2934 domain-containing protein n=1 Tax=Melittangium boletus DSM 14713 TaxID=1294270 RepID=A0A250I8Z1_9BACT|nr:DUF2934 domain-containing protein [Melittangium boletus]ATB27436.1 hypothetical protein MEBOL_000878 [Melittangium boletus DSM 14713]
MARAHAKTNHSNKHSQQKPAPPAPVVNSTAPIAHTPNTAPSAHTAATTDVTSVSAAPAVRHGPTNEQIAARAYELFLSRGGAHGHHDEDWLQAERDLKLGR